MGDGEEAHTALPTALLTVEALIRDETDAEITAYKIDPAFGKPPRQLVLHLDTNRQRKGLAEALLRKVPYLATLRLVLTPTHSLTHSSHPIPSKPPD